MDNNDINKELSYEELFLEFKNINGELDKTREENEFLAKQYQRLQADFENFRKRTLKEKEELRQLGTKKIIENLLPVMDNFQRALEAGRQKGDLEKFLQGVQMIYTQVQEVLENSGLKPIECLGMEFNPELHQAVMKCEVEEEEDNIVLEEIQKGYLLNEKLIRPSMVKVSSRP